MFLLYTFLYIIWTNHVDLLPPRPANSYEMIIEPIQIHYFCALERERFNLSYLVETFLSYGVILLVLSLSKQTGIWLCW